MKLILIFLLTCATAFAATDKDYTDSDFTSRTGLKDSYSKLLDELKTNSIDAKAIYQQGDGCKICLNSDLEDWSAIDTIVTNHTAEDPV